MQHATQSKLASVLYNGREKQSTAEGGKTVPVMNAWGLKRPALRAGSRAFAKSTAAMWGDFDIDLGFDISY